MLEGESKEYQLMVGRIQERLQRVRRDACRLEEETFEPSGDEENTPAGLAERVRMGLDEVAQQLEQLGAQL